LLKNAQFQNQNWVFWNKVNRKLSAIECQGNAAVGWSAFRACKVNMRTDLHESPAQLFIDRKSAGVIALDSGISGLFGRASLPAL